MKLKPNDGAVNSVSTTDVHTSVNTFDKLSFSQDDILETPTTDVDDIFTELENEVNEVNLPKVFKERTFEEIESRIKNGAEAKKLFDEFWFEGELSILVGTTNTGKSILASQIAESIASGEAIDELGLDVEPQPVVYFDFELSTAQYGRRVYNKETNQFYKKHENHKIIEVKRGEILDDNIKSLAQTFKATLDAYKSKVAIIDNITAISSELEESKNAIKFMKELWALCRNENYSIMLIAHTPKKMEFTSISINDIAGSAKIPSLSDSAFAIAKMKGNEKGKYLKQLKVRECEFKYTSENVLTCEIGNPIDRVELLNFSTASEEACLMGEADIQKSEERISRNKKCWELKREGLSNTQIAQEIGLKSHTAIGGYIKAYEEHLKLYFDYEEKDNQYNLHK